MLNKGKQKAKRQQNNQLLNDSEASAIIYESELENEIKTVAEDIADIIAHPDIGSK